MRNLFRCVFVWLVAMTMAQAAWSATAADAFFDTSLGDYAAELKTAQQQGKLGVLLVFEAEGCPFCKRMREQVLSQPTVQQYFHRHFNIFSVDINGSVTVTGIDGKDQTEKIFARTLKVRGTPSFFFFSPDGREMARYSGATRDAETFLDLGRFVAEGHWQKMTFEQYRK
ncbi:MAG: thioredoxin family protein [Rhodocyclaceae bacterium]|nr:thioredoxin family protein [Rhodocyclaceae bacterium]